MSFNFSSWAIKNPIPAIMLFCLLTIAGIFGFNFMKVQDFPDFDLPTVIVNAALPGASPEQLENDVAIIMENSIATIQGVKHIRSTLSDGSLTVTIEFNLDKPIQEALDETRDAIARVRSNLPAELRDPVVRKEVLAGSPILTYAVESTIMDEESLAWFVDSKISRALLAVEGVGAVNRVGGVDREIQVALDPQKLIALKVTATSISQQLKRVQQESSAGTTEQGQISRSIRTIATLTSADEIANMSIPLEDGRVIRLSDVATVIDTIAKPQSIALLNGKKVIGFEIVRARGAGEVEVAEKVQLALHEIQQQHDDLTITEAFNFVDQVEENYEGSMKLLYEGAILAVLVVFLFLRDWRGTLVAAVALPLSVIPTFFVMHLLGFTLNTVTLLSLSLVVGILVDDAIVEIENIMRHLRLGKTPLEAAMEAADEIGLAVIATTFTLISVFLPTAFMSGIAGKFFVQFGWTAAIAVFFSLVVARLLTPMMAAYFLKPPEQPEDTPFWMGFYEKAVTLCLAHRGLTTIAATVFFISGLWLASLLPAGFMPPDDVSQTQVTLTLPPGSTIQDTHELAEKARQELNKNGYVNKIFTAIGGAQTGEDTPVGDVREAVLTISFTHRTERQGVTRQEVEQQFRDRLQNIAGARVKVGMGDSDKYILVLAGEDDLTLLRHAKKIEKELRQIPGTGAITSDSMLTRPELIIHPDNVLAAKLGVTTESIADTLRVATNGDYSELLAKLNLSERQVPIVVKLPENARNDLNILKRLPVQGAFGAVPLESVAEIMFSSGPTDITRFDRKRNINFEIELNGEALGDIEQAILAIPSLNNLPPGVMQTSAGDAEIMGELFASFGLAMGTGVLCIYVVLVLLFKDFVQPVTILAALVLSIPGAFLALFITRSALSMPSIIGLIMLMGIATKNSILLIDYIIIARKDHGLARWEAVLDACRKRARPIIMTTIAMGMGMLPIALGLGADASFRSPMAIVVVGGLITSTFLSLLVIPVLFTYIDDGVQRIFGRRNQENRDFSEKGLERELERELGREFETTS
ncbi:Multidrug resistance protein MdtC [Thalassocella blandensis]|nr:Multidrug resistance protein MdtC [Thalassocella blandensis]